MCCRLSEIFKVNRVCPSLSPQSTSVNCRSSSSSRVTFDKLVEWTTTTTRGGRGKVAEAEATSTRRSHLANCILRLNWIDDAFSSSLLCALQLFRQLWKFWAGRRQSQSADQLSISLVYLSIVYLQRTGIRFAFLHYLRQVTHRLARECWQHRKRKSKWYGNAPSARSFNWACAWFICTQRTVEEREKVRESAAWVNLALIDNVNKNVGFH